MAHEIDQSTGRAAVFVTGEPAWHRLGTVIAHAVDSAEAIQLAGLDWEVQPWPLVAYAPGPATGERRTQKVPGAVANVRSDTGAVLGVVSTGYRVFQNHEVRVVRAGSRWKVERAHPDAMGGIAWLSAGPEWDRPNDGTVYSALLRAIEELAAPKTVPACESAS